jgi:glycosyltransferase involved in cell wall biosynthesis
MRETLIQRFSATKQRFSAARQRFTTTKQRFISTPPPSDEPPDERPPRLSFGSWDDLTPGDPAVIVVCHPDWRGVRTAAYSFREPTVECEDLNRWGDEIVAGLRDNNVATVVVHGYPPGASSFIQKAHGDGINTRVVLHSSMAQHGAEVGEAAVASEVLALAGSGALDRVGFVKAGLAESFAALGYPVAYVPNRAPDLPRYERRDLGPGLHIGIFAEPFWRKNVVTQLGAVALLDDATAHVMRRPDVDYLDHQPMVDHGEVPWDEFLSLQASVDVNLCVTLSECHPLSPIESYQTGVPALMSRTSDVFRSDGRLWDLTTVEVPDDPSEIAKAVRRLIDHADEATERAGRWIARADASAADRWRDFVS